MRPAPGGLGGQEAGFTLVETMIAVAILGIAFTVLLGGMATSALTSDIHRKEATANTVLLSAVESVKDDSRNPYQNAACTGTATYNPYTGVTLPPGWGSTATYQAIKVLSVAYWDGDEFTTTGAAGGCVAAYPLQLVTLQVSSPDGRSTETVGVVKRGA